MISTTQTSSEVMSPLMRTVNGLTIHTKETMYKVDSGASLHMMGIPCGNNKEKNTIRRTNIILEIQTANDIVVSDTQAKVYIKELGAYPWVHSEEESPSLLSLGRHCNELGNSYSWPSGHKAAPSIGSKREEGEQTMLDLLEPFEDGWTERRRCIFLDPKSLGSPSACH